MAAREMVGWLEASGLDPVAWSDRLLESLSVIGNGIVLSDEHGNTAYANKAARSIFNLGSRRGGVLSVPEEGVAWFSECGAHCPAARHPTNQALGSGAACANVVLRCVSAGSETRWLKVSAFPLHDRKTKQLVGVVTDYADITRVKDQQEQLELVAHFDPLTKLPNRRQFLDHLERAIANASRKSNRIAVCYIDLDGFKAVNDSHGHEAGDRLLVEVSRKIKSALRGGDCAARFGGDEFVLLLDDLASSSECEFAVSRILDSLRIRVAGDDGSTLSLSSSIGVALYPSDGPDATTLLRNADAAMYSAKRNGKDRFQLYDTELERMADARRLMLTDVSRALRNDEFCLWYQPKVDLATRRIMGAEALVRWHHPERGLLPPGDFLPAIERTDLVVQLGDWVFGEALRQADRWYQSGLRLPISVNVAGRQLEDPAFFDKLEAGLARHPSLPRNLLQIELAATELLDDKAAVRKAIESCHELGIRFAIDNFGTGSSSFGYFRRLPADILKIDQSVVGAMLDSRDDYLIIRGIVSMADAFGCEVVAQGVATKALVDSLLSVGCNVVQGYGIARAMPETDFEAWCAFHVDQGRPGFPAYRPAA